MIFPVIKPEITDPEDSCNFCRFRETILLYYYQGYGIGEIAKMLDLPEGTISSRLSRGRKKLEELLKERGIEP